MSRMPVRLMAFAVVVVCLATLFPPPLQAQLAPLSPSTPIPSPEQSPPAPEPPPVVLPQTKEQPPPKKPELSNDVRAVTEDSRGERMYADVCKTRIGQFWTTVASNAKSNDPLFKLYDTANKADLEVLRALTTYCSTGRFFLGTLDDQQKCAEVLDLRHLHMDLIHRLMAVRQEPADLIAFVCVKSSEPLKFWTFRGTGILIDQSEFKSLIIHGAEIAYGVEISGKTKLPGGIKIDASSLGRLFQISGKSEVGTASADDKDENGIETQVLITGSHLAGSMFISDSTIHSRFAMPANKIEGSLELNGAQFGHMLNLNNTSVGKRMFIKNTTVARNVSFNAMSMQTLYAESATFKDYVSAEYVRVGGEAEIRKSHFDKGLSLTSLTAHEVTLSNNEFGTEKEPDSGDLQIGGTQAASVSIGNSIVRKQIFAGNSRVGAFELKAVTVPRFDCTDCIIDQYMLLGGAFSKEVRLWGAQIKSQLRLREKNYCARWLPGSSLDIRGLQTRSIAADYDDLRIEAKPIAKGEAEPECSKATVKTMISGAEFDQLLPGFRSPSDEKPTPESSDHQKACALTENQKSILDRSPDDILCWIRQGLSGADGQPTAHDPRPYQLVAQALETAGRQESATKVRIAKLSAEAPSISWNPGTWLPWLLDTLSYYISGYGYQNHIAFGWFFGLVALGILVFIFGRLPHATELPHTSRRSPYLFALYAAFYSIDRAVPPLSLDQAMGEYSILKPWARNYFYAHRAIGTMIITVAIASLTGVFK